MKRSSFKARDHVRPGISEEEVIEIKEAFDVLDTEGKGFVRTKDLGEAIMSLGHEGKNHTVYRMISNLETDGHQRLDFEEFLGLMTAKFNEKDSKEDLKKIFRLFDDDNNGYITLENLKRICKETGEEIGETELAEMIERADSDGDGRVHFEDFYSIMTKKTFI